MIRRLCFVALVVAVSAFGLTMGASAAPKAVTEAHGGSASLKSWPPDLNHYVRKAVPQDLSPKGQGALSVGVFTRDTVVSNTDSSLTKTDTFGDSEPTIAINRAHPNHIAITGFSGSWGANAPIWVSTDGGNIWSKDFTIPVPPGVPSALGCPCDQAIDYGRAHRLSGTFLSFNPTDVYSGTTSDPAGSAAWNWLVVGGATQRTNSTGIGNADQPWLLVNNDPTTPSQDDVYVGYDNFNGAPDMQVAVAKGTDPPDFTIDNMSGTSGGAINPGHRLAVEPRTGYVYSLWQQSPGPGQGGSKNINYRLNRSTNGGATWTLNGSPGGIIVANADSTQPQPKFGRVNALLGGVDHAAVDPNTGDLYYVYGNRDAMTGNNRLSIVRIQGDGMGGVTVGTPHFVTGQVQAALPSVAVASNGRVGVLYDSFDGFSSDGFPIFTAHMALSSDQGVTFTDLVLETFLSPVKDNGDPRQRVLGDYQQLKAVGRTFFGVFTGNGIPFGRPFANTDAIFFKVPAGGPQIAVSGDLDYGLVPRGSKVTRQVTIQNTGDEALVVNGVSFDPGSDPAFSLVHNPGVPQTIQPGGSVIYDVRFAPPANSGPGMRTGTLRIESNDPDNPTVTLSAQGKVGVPHIVVSGSLKFGTLDLDDTKKLPVNIANSGKASLEVTKASLTGSPVFSIVNPPHFPLLIAAGTNTDLTVQCKASPPFGVQTATLTVHSDDPIHPTLTRKAKCKVAP